MENNALAIEKIQGNKNESSRLPGNTRSSLNGIKSSCTLSGRIGRKGNSSWWGTQLEKGTLQPGRLATVGREQARGM